METKVLSLVIVLFFSFLLKSKAQQVLASLNSYSVETVSEQTKVESRNAMANVQYLNLFDQGDLIFTQIDNDVKKLVGSFEGKKISENFAIVSYSEKNPQSLGLKLGQSTNGIAYIDSKQFSLDPGPFALSITDDNGTVILQKTITGPITETIQIPLQGLNVNNSAIGVVRISSEIQGRTGRVLLK